MDSINNKDLEALNFQIEYLQNVCAEKDINIINKNRELEDKSVRSNIVKDKKLHIFTINNDIKISCDNNKPRQWDSIIIAYSCSASFISRQDIKQHFTKRGSCPTFSQDEFQELQEYIISLLPKNTVLTE
jgi:hypothetical protein